MSAGVLKYHQLIYIHDLKFLLIEFVFLLLSSCQKIGANLLSACSVSWLIFSKDSLSAISMIPSLIAEWVVDLELPLQESPF